MDAASNCFVLPLVPILFVGARGGWFEANLCCAVCFCAKGLVFKNTVVTDLLVVGHVMKIRSTFCCTLELSPVNYAQAILLPLWHQP